MARTFRNPVAKFFNETNRPSTEEDRTKFRRKQRKTTREQVLLDSGWSDDTQPERK